MLIACMIFSLGRTALRDERPEVAELAGLLCAAVVSIALAFFTVAIGEEYAAFYFIAGLAVNLRSLPDPDPDDENEWTDAPGHDEQNDPTVDFAE